MAALLWVLFACCLAGARAAAPPEELCDALGGPRKRCGECCPGAAPPVHYGGGVAASTCPPLFGLALRQGAADASVVA